MTNTCDFTKVNNVESTHNGARLAPSNVVQVIGWLVTDAVGAGVEIDAQELHVHRCHANVPDKMKSSSR